MASTLILGIVYLAIILTSTLSGILGMGGGFLLAGVLAFVLPLPTALTLHAISQFTANGYRSYLLASNIEWRIVKLYCYGLLVSILFFSLFVIELSKPHFYLMLGFIALSSHFWPKKLSLNIEKTSHAIACGMSVGTLHLFVGVAGPLLDVFYQRTSLNRYQIVATKAATQCIGHLTRVFFYVAILQIQWQQSNLTWEVILFAMCLAMIGTFFGRQLLKKVGEKQFQSFSRALLSVLGVLFISKGILSLYF